MERLPKVAQHAKKFNYKTNKTINKNNSPQRRREHREIYTMQKQSCLSFAINLPLISYRKGAKSAKNYLDKPPCVSLRPWRLCGEFYLNLYLCVLRDSAVRFFKPTGE
jgi:hypothetical protein